MFFAIISYFGTLKNFQGYVILPINLWPNVLSKTLHIYNSNLKLVNTGICSNTVLNDFQFLTCF